MATSSDNGTVIFESSQQSSRLRLEIITKSSIRYTTTTQLVSAQNASTLSISRVTINSQLQIIIRSFVRNRKCQSITFDYNTSER
ncbi:hypothetical protein SS50377_24127 [Spironucleus salmonicida]|uniref:Uncharacterized protein n=1 Tax=Spironucleus salmonicida TaxID=348837 RepID=A0A9P8LTP1_9EUKA|nr:hypothetical protein SS50377_24127 [Spironucleus salmonicida]